MHLHLQFTPRLDLDFFMQFQVSCFCFSSEEEEDEILFWWFFWAPFAILTSSFHFCLINKTHYRSPVSPNYWQTSSILITSIHLRLGSNRLYRTKVYYYSYVSDEWLLLSGGSLLLQSDGPVRNVVAGIVCGVLLVLHLLMGLVAHKLDHLENMRLSSIPLCGQAGRYQYRVLVKTGWQRGAGEWRTSLYRSFLLFLFIIIIIISNDIIMTW